MFFGITVGLNNKNQNNKEAKNVSRTIMIYMVGADLESKSGLASSDLEGISLDQESLKNTKVVLIAGGSNKWNNTYINANETSIFSLTENGFEKVQQNNIKNMGNANTLSSFLNYIYDNYKTDQYDLLFWDHGGAIEGNEYDELNNGDNLSLKEIKIAFDDSPFKTKKLEMVIFRTCLNGTIEYANVLKDYSNYMVASEEVTVGMNGYSPLTFINNIKKENSSIEIGKLMISSYTDSVDKMCNNIKNCTNVTYSIVNLNKIKKLTNSLDDFFGEVKTKIDDNFSNISKIRSNMTQYANSIPEYDMIDLYELVDNLKDYSNKSEELKKIIKDTVIYNYSNNDYSNGLSIYFPYTAEIFKGIYEDINTSKNYNEFLTLFAEKKNNNPTTTFNFNTMLQSNSSEEGSDFEMNLTDEQVESYSKSKALILLKNADGTYKPLFNTKDIKLNGNKLQSKIRGKALRVTNSKDESNWLLLNEIYHENDLYKYETVAILENINGELAVDSVTLTIQVDNQNPNGIIISSKMREESKTEEGTSLPDIVSKNYKDYDAIAFASSSYYLEFNEDGTYKSLGKSNGIIEGEEYKMNDFKFIKENYSKENEYYAVFTIDDVNGNQYSSNLIKIN